MPEIGEKVKSFNQTMKRMPMFTYSNDRLSPKMGFKKIFGGKYNRGPSMTGRGERTVTFNSKGSNYSELTFTVLHLSL
jgi:hypothetical protein